MHINKKYFRLAALTLTMVLVFSIFPVPLQAEQGLDEDIRVSLFISQRGTVPAVTLHASQLILEEVNASGARLPWTTLTDKEIRVALNQYKVRVLLTESITQARELKQQLQSKGETAYIIERPSAEGTRYYVYAAPSLNKELVQQARERIEAYSFISSTSLAGPYYVHAGTFSSENEAWKHIESLPITAGAAAVARERNKHGDASYSVWVGAAADEAGLNQAKSVIADAATANASSSYILQMKEVDASSNLSRFEINAEQRLWVSAGSGNIMVKERYGRSYRGNIEITSHNEQLAVINQLPLEEYLYGVVGAEMGTGWPQAALQAQAVVARTYALALGNAYGIAQISDTTYDQAYRGATGEANDVIQAVDSTKGIVLRDAEGKLIIPFYYSNAGGMTASGEEVWGTEVDYLTNVPSPDDGPLKGKLMWDRVVLPDGTVGYVRSDFIKETSSVTRGGLDILRAEATNVNVRKAPYVDNASNAAIAQINTGDQLVRIDQVIESTAYSWIRGPFSSEQVKAAINRHAGSGVKGELLELEVTKRGPSGRVIAMKANGEEIKVDNPDQFRTVMGGLPSTRFEVEQTGRFEVLGKQGKVRSVLGQGTTLHAVTGTGSTKPLQNEILSVNSKGKVSYHTAYPSYRFIGYGYGHGLGMSQWGARDLAEFMGYDYEEILLYYYQGVKLSKE